MPLAATVFHEGRGFAVQRVEFETPLHLRCVDGVWTLRRYSDASGMPGSRKQFREITISEALADELAQLAGCERPAVARSNTLLYAEAVELQAREKHRRAVQDAEVGLLAARERVRKAREGA